MTGTDDGHDVARYIREQHDEVRRLFAEVEASYGEHRRQVLEELVRYLAVHETVEEDVLYPAVRAIGPAGQAVADARMEEERHAKAMLAFLQGVGTEGDEFPRRLAVLRDAVLRHAEDEERTVLPLLEGIPDPAVRRRVADAVGVVQPAAAVDHDLPPEQAPEDPMAAAVDDAHHAVERIAS
jgi:hemerythrin superfamily protein